MHLGDVVLNFLELQNIAAMCFQTTNSSVNFEEKKVAGTISSNKGHWSMLIICLGVLQGKMPFFLSLIQNCARRDDI